MNVTNITTDKTIVNDDRYGIAKDGTMSLERFVHSLIREHAKHGSDGYYLYVYQLPLIDQQILLSHVVDAEDYAHFMECPIRLHCAIEENKKHMQALIDEHLDDVYAEDMREMGLVLFQQSNGDVLWVRR